MYFLRNEGRVTTESAVHLPSCFSCRHDIKKNIKTESKTESTGLSMNVEKNHAMVGEGTGKGWLKKQENDHVGFICMQKFLY